MDSKHIEDLLQKYWNAETSLDEEQHLREFFSREGVPENLNETASLFRYFEMQKKTGVNDISFDANLKKKLSSAEPTGKAIRFSPFSGKGAIQIARIAAGLLVVVAATFFIRQEIRKAYPDEPEDTYTDPKVAFEETKKALMMIGKSFNKAQKEASKINVFNEATEIIQNKQNEEQKEEEKKTNI